MSIIQVKDLLEAGVHFGHRVSRWNPKMKPYIYGKRNLIHIINLKETIRGLVRAYNFLLKLTSQGGEVLLVGTKRQAKIVVLDEAKRSGMPYVTERWLGGTLTNFSTIRERLKRLQDLQSLEDSGAIEGYSKKMQSSLAREKKKISRNLSGILSMGKIPDALIIIDQRREKNALLEAEKLGIPVICILDTDGDPDLVDICIPGNDDAMRSIQVLLMKLTDAIVAGRKVYAESGAAQEKAKKTESATEFSSGDRTKKTQDWKSRPPRKDNKDGRREAGGGGGGPRKGGRPDNKPRDRGNDRGNFRPNPSNPSNPSNKPIGGDAPKEKAGDEKKPTVVNTDSPAKKENE
ncbi:MAG: 30S ribosomal protein S2 [Planctomycetota bacterium]